MSPVDAPSGSSPAPRPLDGVRVVETGQLMAGPVAGTILGYFGADVVKVEPPGGDPVRGWRVLDEDGTSLWWRSIGRNKRLVTLDLRREEGRRILRRLLADADVWVENFRPGTLENWGLDPEEIRAEHPDLVVARVSGFGQTGPYASRPGFAAVCEGFGGLRYVTGEPGERPMRANLSLGDSLAALHAALGVLLALVERERRGGGQVVDVSITEAVFAMMEGAVAEYDRCGVVREPAGSTITGVVPTNVYPCRDGRWVIVGGSGDSIFRRLMGGIGRGDLGEDPELATNAGRVPRREEIDAAIAAWTRDRTVEEALARLEDLRVPAAPVYSVADQMADTHFRARGLFEETEAGGRPLRVPAIPPKLSRTPGATRWAGRDLGADTESVLEELGLDPGEIARLREAGVV